MSGWDTSISANQRQWPPAAVRYQLLLTTEEYEGRSQGMTCSKNTLLLLIIAVSMARTPENPFRSGEKCAQSPAASSHLGDEARKRGSSHLRDLVGLLYLHPSSHLL